jgi:UDP-N-acetylglucosamine 3-dehydrogenase
LGRKDFEDLAILILKYRNAVGIIEGGWLPPGNYRDLMVVGSKKSVTSDLAKQTITLHDIHVEPSGRAFKAVDKGSVNVNMKYEEPLKRELADFVECIETGRDPIANGQAASRVIMIAQKALEAAKQKRSVGIDETK